MSISREFMIGFGFCALIVFCFWWAHRTKGDYKDLFDGDDADSGKWRPQVDPWSLQQVVMLASGQKMAGSPQLNENVLLYWALIAEEFGETSEALLEVVQRVWPALERTPEQQVIVWALAEASQLQAKSRKFRKALPALGKFDYRLHRREAKALLDGTTDVQVVNSGLALAAGLPGAMAYLAVQTSNLSKRNDEGVIARTADGKWIKDPKNYVEPDLDRVLDSALPLYEDEAWKATRPLQTTT